MTGGGYSIIRELGSGAMGRVFEARQEATGEVVAIKTLSDELRNDPAAQRILLDEAAVVVQLSHPRVVELLDIGFDDTGAIFLVMELVRGTTLRAWEKEWPGVRAALAVFADMLDALASAHAQGIVHGDIKPSNVLLDERGAPKIADFGIARVIDPLRREEGRRIEGTPKYMAPEQIFRPDDIGPTTDLYAIGVMLRQLLGRDEIETNKWELLVQKAKRPPPFEARDGLILPPALGELIDALVDPNPRSRPRFAAHVRRELMGLARTVDEAIGSGAPRVIHVATILDQTLDTSAPTPQAVASSPSDLSPSSRPETLLHRLRPLPLIGRDNEVATLRVLVHQVVESGGPRILLVTGRAGEGKSRIARMGLAYVEHEGLMVGAAASFTQSDASANVDLRACIRRLLGAPTEDFDTTIYDSWRWFAHRLTRDDLRVLYVWLRSEATGKAATRVVARALAEISRIRPIYLWLDDLAWSRDGAMELVTALLDADARMAIVATMRTGSVEHARVSDWFERTSRHERVQSIELRALGRRARAAIMTAVGPVENRCAEALALMLDHPTLIIVEAIRDWIELRLLEWSEEGYVPAPGVSCELLAANAHGVVDRRLTAFFASFGDRADLAQDVLLRAALLGEHFEERVLRAACGTDLKPILDRSLLLGMVRVERNGVYRFDHALFAEALARRAERSPKSKTLMLNAADALVAEYEKLRPEALEHAVELYRTAGSSARAYEVALLAILAMTRARAFGRIDAMIARLEQWATEDAADVWDLPWAHVNYAKARRAFEALDYSLALDLIQRARAIVETRDPAMARTFAAFHATVCYFANRFSEAAQILDVMVASEHAPFEAYYYSTMLSWMRLDLDAALASASHAAERATTSWERAAFDRALADFTMLHGDDDGAAALLERIRTMLSGSTRGDLADYLLEPRLLLSSTRGDFRAVRTTLQPWLESLVARDDTWALTEAKAYAAACSAALDDEDTAVRSVAAAIVAYRATCNDEIGTWWSLRAAESLLRGRGLVAAAEAIATMLDARRAEIDAAFE